MGKILYVAKCDPWGEWCNSGFIRHLCLELRSRHLLFGAISANARSGRHLLRSPRLDWLFGRLKRRFGGRPHRRQRVSEREGVLAGLLLRLPPNSAVIYHYLYPDINPDLPIRRFLFQDLTVSDAVRTGGYGTDRLSHAEVREKSEAQRQALATADGVISFSTYAAESICRDYGYPREKIAVIGAGPVRAPRRAPNPGTHRYAAGRVLFIGRKWNRKGGPLLLEAFRAVRKAVPSATLTIAGPPIKPPADPGIVCLGHVSNRRIRRLYAQSSLFCMPAQCETWGLVYVEAAQAGLPIVGFNAWAMPDIVLNGRTGVLIDEMQIAPLGDAIISLLRNPPVMAEMGRAAQRRCRDVLSWPRVADRLLHFVDPSSLHGRSPVPITSTPA
jgi:glycosyltransferase involved in cell wall biosynthesis